jgi:quercetin dioxygenase-like cupin family protein
MRFMNLTIMNIQGVMFSITDWSQLSPVEHRGERGTSFWRTFEAGNVRVRMVEYSPGFKSDRWCPRGHILLVLEGELAIGLKDGREFTLASGTGFQVSDDEANPHLAYTDKGAKVFIVD